MIPGTVRQGSDVTPVRPDGDTVEERHVLAAPDYAESLEHRNLTFGPGTSKARLSSAHDELVYVTAGTGQLVLESGSHDLAEGSAALLLAGDTWQIETSESLRLSSVLVPAPPGPAATSFASQTASSTEAPVARLGVGDAQAATCGRQFEVLYDAANGSRGATQFVGFIPPSGAPEHYHLYDEICVIVRGVGHLHANGTVQPLSAGSAFHVAPRLLHSLENTGTEDLWVLGVFRPAGSAAAAYYPDGRPAPGHDVH